MFVIDFRGKAEIVDTFFCETYSLINTESDLPTKKTRESLSTIRFTSDYILKIFKNLDPNKVHGHGFINNRMVT